MSDDLNWAQHARVAMVGDDERLVLLPLAILAEARPMILEPPATDIWQRLVTPRRESDLVDELAADYDQDPDTIRGQVRDLLRELAEVRLVRCFVSDVGA